MLRELWEILGKRGILILPSKDEPRQRRRLVTGALYTRTSGIAVLG
jgi:hypothetical protein